MSQHQHHHQPPVAAPMWGRDCPAVGPPPSPLRGVRPRRWPPREPLVTVVTVVVMAAEALLVVAAPCQLPRRCIPRSTRIRTMPILSIRTTGSIRRCLCRLRRTRLLLGGEGPQRRPMPVPLMPPLRHRRCTNFSRRSRRRRLGLERGPEPL